MGRGFEPDKLVAVATSYILEISVETLERALAAERGGAHRIELCGKLSQSGLTPDAELLRSVREMVRIPIFAMIRPRAGDFAYSDAGATPASTSNAPGNWWSWHALCR